MTHFDGGTRLQTPRGESSSGRPSSRLSPLSWREEGWKKQRWIEGGKVIRQKGETNSEKMSGKIEGGGGSG